MQKKICGSPKIVENGMTIKKEPWKAEKCLKMQKSFKKGYDKKEDSETPQKNSKYSIEQCGKSTLFFLLRGKDLARNARFQVGCRVFEC